MKVLLVALALLLGGLVAYDYAFPESAARTGLAIERWRSGLSPAQIDVDGVRVSYLAGGQGETLLLVHGFGADKDNWTRVARELIGHFRVIAVDLPGFGDSERLPQADYRIAAQATRLHRISEALDLERFHLGGSSMGGHISLAYAARHPQRVRSLWLLAPGGVAGADPSPLRQAYADTGENALIVERAEDFPEVMAFTMADPPWLPYSIRYRLGQRAARDHDLLQRIFADLARSEPVNEPVHGLAIPTLIVWGTEDRALDVSGGPILQALLPRAQLITREGIGHLPMIEEPGRAAADLLAFQHSLQR